VIDEYHYRKTYRGVNELPCPFEKAILSTRCGCALSQRILIAEREACSCTAREAQRTCMDLLHEIRAKATFSLKIPHLPGSLPHGKEVKVQIGGMLGLQAALNPAQADAGGVADIRSLVEAAVARYGSIEALPYQDIMKSVVAYQHRQRRGR
jgi:hypothetical protein